MSIGSEKCQTNGTMSNDVVSLQQTAMATEEQTHNDYYKKLIGTSGAGSVSSLSLNDTTIKTTATVPIDTSTVTTSNTDSTEEEKMVPNFANKSGAINLRNNQNASNIPNNVLNKSNNNNTNNGNNMKAKRRRRKSSKQKTNSKPYKKSNWNFQKRGRNSLSRLVPYNTNQFLMEEHMSEINVDGDRCRDSSFSFDSDNDKEEYFSKEFCNVYEKAKSDRLYEMNKIQLIQEYLQLEASYDKLSNSLGKLNGQLENGGGASNNILKSLAERVQELSAENLELRRQMADIRSRESRNNGSGHNKSSSNHCNESVRTNADGHSNPVTSEDSESDSNISESDSSDRSRSIILNDQS